MPPFTPLGPRLPRICAGRRVDPVAVVARLATSVHWPGAEAVRARSWRLLVHGGDFDAWLIAWPVGGGVEVHDHGVSAGAFSVVSGELVEAVPERDDAGVLRLSRRVQRAGTTRGFAAGHVHDVSNECGPPALSVHVYSPALTTMTFYDLTANRLEPREVRWTTRVVDEAPGPVATRPDRRLAVAR